MNTQPPTDDPIPKSLEELRLALSQLRDNKGKPRKGITSSVKENWSRLVTTVFVDPDNPVDTLFQELSLFPPSVVASGIASAWENMDQARRASYLGWLESLDSEKAASQKVVLIPSLLERFPSASLELLCGLSLSQEVKNRLAGAIFGTKPDKVGTMITPDIPEWKARQALERLCQISEGPKVEMKAKFEVLRLTLKTIVERKMQKDALSQRLIQHVESQLPNLAPSLQELLQELLKDLNPKLSAGLSPPAAPVAARPTQEDAESPRPMAPPAVPETFRESETIPTVSVQPNVLDRLAGGLDTLQVLATLLMDTRGSILQLEQESQTLKAQLDASQVAEEAARGTAAVATAALQEEQHRLQVLEEESRETQKALHSSLANVRELESELSAALERESQSGTQLRQREAEFVKEREDLQRLIQANAERRLQEFRNSVGGSLRKLLSRVPDRGAPVPPELGAVLLARLHEVIDELESKGIRTRPEREVVSR